MATFTHKLLMCRPWHYGVKYRINPWMDPDPADDKDRVDYDLAQRQWTLLHHTLVRLGAYVEYVEPVWTLPDMVFTANAGLVYGKKVVPAKFLHGERRREQRHFRAFFKTHGFEIVDVFGPFEGAGDGLFCGGCYFAGHGFRSCPNVQRRIAKKLKVRPVLCQLVKPHFYHLDTCFCPVRDHCALVYPDAFSDESLAAMDGLIEMVPVPPQEAERFACNAVVLGNDIVIPAGCPLTRERLVLLNFRVHEVEMSEFIKAGGACKCLTLQLEETGVN